MNTNIQSSNSELYCIITAKKFDKNNYIVLIILMPNNTYFYSILIQHVKHAVSSN